MIFSSYRTAEKYYYSSVVCITYILSLVLLFTNLINTDRRSKQIEAMDDFNEKVYANNILCAWDNSMTTQNEVDDFSGSLGNDLLLLLDEARAFGRIMNRTLPEVFVLYLRRIFGFFLYIIVQFAAFSSFFYLKLLFLFLKKILHF
jgi:hypothetical protein